MPEPPQLSSVDEAIARLYPQLLAREPNPDEAILVKKYLGSGRLEPAALEDFLWSLLLHPEFQYLY